MKTLCAIDTLTVQFVEGALFKTVSCFNLRMCQLVSQSVIYYVSLWLSVISQLWQKMANTPQDILNNDLFSVNCT